MSGKKSNSTKKTSKIVWTLPNCNRKSFKEHEIGKAIESPPFDIVVDDHITKWSLWMYPNGIDLQSNVSLFLKLMDSDSAQFNVQCRFGVAGKTEKASFISSESKMPYQKDGKCSVGKDKLMNHDKLFNSKSGFIFNGKLTVTCEITLKVSILYPAFQDKAVTLNQSLALDYKKAFESGMFADLQLKTNDGEVLNASKTILCVRSPAFNAILSQESNSVDVPDFNSKTMKEVLRFIYCNEVEGLKEISRDLVYAAEKYQLEGLKKLCLNSIIGSLSNDNLVDSLIISHRVSKSSKLFNECLNLINSNTSKIITDQKWNELPKEILVKITQRMLESHSNTVNNIIHI